MRAILRGDPEDDLEDGLHPSLGAFIDYKNFGRFPYAGGIRDQDPNVMRDFRIIESAIATERARTKRRGR